MIKLNIVADKKILYLLLLYWFFVYFGEEINLK